MDRRRFALAAASTLLLPACARTKPPPRQVDAAARLAAVEKAAGGRLGVYILDTDNARNAGWRANETFALCSTFKLSLAAFVLREARAGRLSLDEPLAYTRADLIGNSPETQKNVAQGHMPILALAEAAQLYSDNCAANLLLRRLGGPADLTRFWREIGDAKTRLDNYETALNRMAPGEVHNTTTPFAMVHSVARFLTGDALAPADHARLNEWMERTATGSKRIRAALPAGWRGGDKTGTAGYEGLATKINDIAVLRPPGGRAPLLVAAYYEAADTSGKVRPEDEAVLARVGEVAVAWAG